MITHLLLTVLLVPGSASALTFAAPATTTTSPTRVVAPSSEPQEASTDYLLKLGGVDGESKEGSAIEPDEIDAQADPQEASVDYFLEIDGVEGESAAPGIEPDDIDVQVEQEAKKKGNVEYNWKVEEGQKNTVPGVEPDEIDVKLEDEQAGKLNVAAGDVNGDGRDTEEKPLDVANPKDPQPVMPDFSILLGGGLDEDDDGDNVPTMDEDTRVAVEKLLLEGMQEQGAPAETLSLNYEEIKTTAKQEVKLFGLFPLTISATVEIDGEGNIDVDYPWWGFLAWGKDGDTLGAQIFNSLSNVLKTKHDTIKNSIGNIR